jgi:hypothetical protein
MRFLSHGNEIGKMLLLKSIVMLALLFFSTPPLHAAQVNLAWDANNPAPDRYQVFQRVEGAGYNYSSPAWSGSATTCTLNNLSYDTTYYFVVRAVSANLQSTDSNQVTFRRALPVHQITASAGAGGVITPSGSIDVPQGGSRSFNITPQPGYRIANVRVNGSAVGSVATYTFSAVSKDHSISASFERIQSGGTPGGAPGAPGGAPGKTNVVFGNSPDVDHPGTVQDTFINLNTNAYASSTLLNIYTWPANTPANAVLMKFDLSRIPVGATIHSATLTLYQVEAGGDAAYDVSVQKIVNHNPDLNAANGFTYDGVNSWTPNAASFNGIPMAQADIAAPEDVNRLDRHAGYKNWNVTGMVQDWVLDADANYGLALNSGAVAGADSYRFFASSKATDAAIRPFLEITYTEPGISAVFGNSPDADYPGTVQDTFINLNADINASSTRLNTYTWPANTPANAVLMKFDLSLLPSGAKVQSASLALYQVEAGGDASYGVTVQKIVNHNPDLLAANGFTYDGVNRWTANSVCFNNVPMAQADIAAAEDLNHLDRHSGYKHWDVTGMVQDWVQDADSNYGLMLNSAAAAGSDSFRFFASSKAADPAVRPFLKVVYTEAEAMRVVFGNTPDADYPGTVQDTFLNLNHSVHTALPQLNTYTWPASKPANAVLMQFDLSQLPNDARILSADLRLYQIEAGGDGAYNVAAHKIINHNPDLRAANGFTFDGINTWSANTTSHNNIPMAQADMAPAEDVIRLDWSNGYKTWVVTGMVQDWVGQAAPNYGLMLNSDSTAGSDSFRFFASSEAADPALRPVLEVTYTSNHK